MPKSAKKKFHSALRHNWRKLREIQLDGNPRDLDAHSLRYAFNQALKLETSVTREVRLDILGHAGVVINEEVYGDEDGMPLCLKKQAIDPLPRVFWATAILRFLRKRLHLGKLENRRLE
ncbi:hypothetical protein OS189_04290 [Sulfitobacter sp. F26169L]|uniref:hypothetical protein n=1 Tax=Sulfitobacter sp. F26169L TaxID=2996015 RepID=UPI002260D5B3|nr:hypothetical protein [Sulfitobacter sp. F26169L]MCX7565559.1 hypothetical protein [Sulfitobacter sp. F26169L]